MSSFTPNLTSKQNTFTMVLPGTNKESHKLTEALLTKNNKEFDVFFNDMKFHNHLVHHVLAAYSFGANKEKLQEIFENHAKQQRSPPASIGTITRDNYKQYIGEAKAYSSFYTFFKSEIDHHGIIDSIRRWIWHGDFLARAIGGIFHPLIHIGYGLEFELPGTVAEGMAMLACTEDNYTTIIPVLPDLQRGSLGPVQIQIAAENANTTTRGFMTQMVDQLANQITSHLGFHDEKKVENGSDNLSVADVPSFLCSSFLFKLFIKIKHDPIFDGIVSYGDDGKISKVLSNKAATDRIKYYTNLWALKEDTEDLQLKFRELHLFIALALGSSGVRDDHKDTFKLDFFMMHGLTSSEFIHQFIARITPSETVLLLNAQLSAIIVLYLINNRPNLNVEGLLRYETSLDHQKTNNPWTLAFDRSLDCKEAHVIKTVRSCAVGQTISGSHQDISLNDIWLKVSNLSIDKDGQWEIAGVGFDETWK